MKFRLLAILLFCSLISIAQEKDEDLDHQKNQILIQHDDTNKVLKLIKIGTEYFSVNYDTALVLLKKSHQISLKLGYKEGEIRAKQKIGHAYYIQNNFLKAEELFKEAQEKAIKYNFKKLIAIGLRSKAALLHERGRFEKGILLLKEALFIHKSMKDSINTTIVLNRISVFYRESKDIDSALFYNNKAIAASMNLNHKKLIGRSYRNLAIIYTIKNELNKAESFFIKALDLQSIHSREKELLFTKYQFGILLIKQKKYNQAIDILNTCKERTRKIGILKQLPHIYEKLSLAYSGNRQYKEAYQSAIEFHNLSEILRYDKENQRKIEETRNKIISEREKATILEEQILKEKSNQIKQTFLIIALIIALIISIFLSKISKKKSIETALLKQKTNAAKEIIDEHEKIDNWIAKELHDDIGGSVSAIKLKLSRTESEVKNDFRENMKEGESFVKVDIHKYKLSLKSLRHEINNLENVNQSIRKLSHSLSPVTFQGESFISLIEHKITDLFPENYNITLHCLPKKELNDLDENIKFNVYRILQNLSANIIKHAKATEANLQVIGHKDHLTIVVEDNGVGFDTNKIPDGIGLQLTKKRVFLINGKIEINSNLGKGTTIIIDLPYKLV